MARQPLDQFASRIVNNGEIDEFLEALLEKGCTLTKIQLFIDDKLANQKPTMLMGIGSGTLRASEQSVYPWYLSVRNGTSVGSGN